ncbi:MAG: enoyl-CoA hydratase/isomerase family protein [Pseudomonadota bacterium]
MSALLLDKHPDGVAILTLNRPDIHNAFDDAVITDMIAALDDLNVDNNVRVVVLSANGESFSAGADLNWMRRMATYTEKENLRDASILATLMRTLNNLSKPTIARIHGSAYGGGVGLVACCDIAIASVHTTFALSETRLGLIPAVISPYVIAAIGERMARRYFLTAERFDADEAHHIGLIHQVEPDEITLDKAIDKIVTSLLAASPAAQREAKKLIGAVVNRTIDDALILDTVERIARARVSAEGREGIAAFLEKRSPTWIKP